MGTKKKVDGRLTRRWHMVNPEGRIFIVYNNDEAGVAKTAERLGCAKYEPSGYYEYRTNSIIGGMDGPQVLIDWGKNTPEHRNTGDK